MSDEPEVTPMTSVAVLEDVKAKALSHFEWPDAKALSLHYGAIMQNLPGYRQGMAASDIVTLAYEFAVIDHLVALFDASDDGAAKLAGPAMAKLRDICVAEGVRRGVMLSAGDDVTAISLAVELMEEMVAAFTPTWAVGAR